MKEKITFLGIETSCDETAAAVIRENENGTANILSNVILSENGSNCDRNIFNYII